MSYFTQAGPTFRLHPDLPNFQPKLPVETFSIQLDGNGQIYLQLIENFKKPKKIYGDLSKRCDKILNTFWDRDKGTGVLLAGEKGSGKSLLAKEISIQAREKLDVPTIVVGIPISGEQFNHFIQGIEQPCVILFDEFEKIYSDKDAQQRLLTLLDGVYPSKKLFVLTVNNKLTLDENLHNRPGRIYYCFDYRGLEEKFIRDYCEDNLKNKNEIDSIITISEQFDAFNFDMLQALVEEMNRYDVPASKCVEDLNVKPIRQNFDYDIVSLVLANSGRYDLSELGTKMVHFSPFDEFSFYLEEKYNSKRLRAYRKKQEMESSTKEDDTISSLDDDDDDAVQTQDEDEQKNWFFSHKDLVKITKSGEMHFKNAATNHELVLRKAPKKYRKGWSEHFDAF